MKIIFERSFKVDAVQLHQLYHLFDEIVRQEFSWQEEFMDEKTFMQSIAGEELYLARFQGEIIGFLSFWRADSFVHNLFVRRSFRKQGVAQKLIALVETTTTTDLALKCALQNTQAKNYYLAQGWQLVESCFNIKEPYYLLIKKRC